jgi:tRNA (cytosine38-C5)-methyltransferase
MQDKGDFTMKRAHGDLEGPSTTETLTYIEFYAGIGGWSMALDEALRSIAETDESSVTTRPHCAAALDHSDLCLGVYRHNHRIRSSSDSPTSKRSAKQAASVSTRQVSIEKITLEQLIECQADVWMMSPPCQPHTRQHSNQSEDLSDPRSNSFLHICHLLEELPTEHRPSLIMLENVVGFEASGSCQRWRKILSDCDYAVGHFHLTPTQVALPNDRPRYYSVAIYRGESTKQNPQPTQQLPSSSPSQSSLRLSLDRYVQQEDDVESPLIPNTAIPELSVFETDDKTCDKDSDHPLPPLRDFLHPESSLPAFRTTLAIPEKIAKRNAAWCFDICTPESTQTACFTSGYGRYVRGTGSVLYTGSDAKVSNQFQRRILPQDREFDADWSKELDVSKDLRYFSGREIAPLFGFPDTFEFPSSCTLKQQWKLMGNSINVRVAARVLELGLRLRRPPSSVIPRK